ncbi:MAG: outer membrane lipoprotein-sorting protein [Saccharospirillum sp.]
MTVSKTSGQWWVWVLLLLGASNVFAQTDPKAIELLERMDQLYQQEASYAVMSMHIRTPDYERTLRMESWSLGLDYALVRVLEPVRDRGVTTLKRENDMWNYLPRVNRVVKVPPSMMMGSWMGSDFTNDDLMRDASWVEEYAVRLTETEALYRLHLTPREQTVTVWGGMEIDVDITTLLPLEQRYYDEAGSLMRTMTFSDVQTFDGHTLPAKMVLTPLNKDGHQTTVEYHELSFNPDISESWFSLQSLRR